MSKTDLLLLALSIAYVCAGIRTLLRSRLNIRARVIRALRRTLPSAHRHKHDPPVAVGENFFMDQIEWDWSQR